LKDLTSKLFEKDSSNCVFFWIDERNEESFDYSLRLSDSSKTLGAALPVTSERRK
jgi:hypothetical protein